MSGNSWFSLLIFIAAFVIIFLISRKAGKNEHFDEMQLKVRGDAYKFSFFTVIILLAAVGLCYATGDFNISDYISPDMILFSILYAGLLVFSVYSISKGAFFFVREKGNFYLAACFIVIVTNLPVLISRIVDGELIQNGSLSFNHGGANILNIILFVTMIAVIIIKKAGCKKETTE